jgi:hypothetical protein
MIKGSVHMKNVITFFVISLSLTACISAPVKTPPASPVSSAPTEETPVLISEVQTLLNKKGYGVGTPDGIAGPKTRSAIRKFEKDGGLPVDGLVDDALYAALKQGNGTPAQASNDKSTPSGKDSRPCVANLSSEGSFWTSRTFRTYQDFSGVTRAAAFDQIVPALAGDGWTVTSSDKDTGVITSWAKPNYAQGETESLNAVIRNKGAAGIRVEFTYIAPALAIVPESQLQKGFCKYMADVQSASK